MFLKSLSQEQLKDCFLQEAGLKKEEEESSVDSDSGGHDDDDVQTLKMVLQESSRDQVLMTPHQVVVVIQMTQVIQETAMRVMSESLITQHTTHT